VLIFSFQIFSFLNAARDLCRVTAVCSRWYDLGNDEYLYKHLLSFVLSAEEIESRFARVPSCKIIFMQIHSKVSFVVVFFGVFVIELFVAVVCANDGLLFMW
jgi:hypothetical protein